MGRELGRGVERVGYGSDHSIDGYGLVPGQERDEPKDGQRPDGTGLPEEYLRNNRRWFGILVPDWLAHRSEIPWTVKAVYGYLLRKLSPHEHFAFPRQETIAVHLGISLRTVKASVRLLKSHGLVSMRRCQIKHGKWKSETKKAVYFLVANHPWAVGAKTQPPEDKAEDAD